MTRAPFDQLTIVLTLKDRTPFTYRWMRYMNDIKCPYRILVADGGADADVEAQLRRAGNYPDLRYTYLRYPFDRDYGAYYQKFADVVERVSTPYVLLADNDDFFLLENIPAFIRFLDDHPGFVSCGGTPVVLRLLSGDHSVVGLPSAAQYEAVADTRPKSIALDGAVDRLCYFMSNVQRHYLWSTWYQVHRTPAVQQGMGLVRAHAFADPVAFEIHLHLCLLAAGGYQQLDLPWLVGQAGSSQLTSALESGANLVERFIASNSFSDVHRSLKSLPLELSQSDWERINKAIAQWFAGEARKHFPAPESAAATAGMGRFRRLSRRWWRPRGSRLRSRSNSSPLRLPAIEKHILDPVP